MGIFPSAQTPQCRPGSFSRFPPNTHRTGPPEAGWCLPTVPRSFPCSIGHQHLHWGPLLWHRAFLPSFSSDPAPLLRQRRCWSRFFRPALPVSARPLRGTLQYFADDFFQYFVGHTTILLFGKIILPKLTLVEAPLVPFLLTNKICEIMSEQTIWGHI